MPYLLVLERASGTHKYSVQFTTGPTLLHVLCSVPLPQVHSNKLRLAALEAPVFHPFWCLAAQRKGMVINMTDRELLETILQQVSEIKQDVKKNTAMIELQVKPDIQKLSEGHNMILERIDDKIERRTEQLQDQLDVHQAAIMRINREIQELNKAQ